MTQWDVLGIDAIYTLMTTGNVSGVEKYGAAAVGATDNTSSLLEITSTSPYASQYTASAWGPSYTWFFPSHGSMSGTAMCGSRRCRMTVTSCRWLSGRVRAGTRFGTHPCDRHSDRQGNRRGGRHVWMHLYLLRRRPFATLRSGPDNRGGRDFDGDANQHSAEPAEFADYRGGDVLR